MGDGWLGQRYGVSVTSAHCRRGVLPCGMVHCFSVGVVNVSQSSVRISRCFSARSESAETKCFILFQRGKLVTGSA